MEIKYAEGAVPTVPFGGQKDAFAAALAKTRTARTRQLTTREIKRIRQRDADRQAKRATRSWRRAKIQAAQDSANALGLARVYLLNRGTPAMRENVRHHVDVELAFSIAAQLNINVDDARTQLASRFEDLLRASGELH